MEKQRKEEKEKMYQLVATFREMNGDCEFVEKEIVKVKSIEEAKKEVMAIKKERPNYFYIFQLFDSKGNFIGDLK